MERSVDLYTVLQGHTGVYEEVGGLVLDFNGARRKTGLGIGRSDTDGKVGSRGNVDSAVVAVGIGCGFLQIDRNGRAVVDTDTNLFCVPGNLLDLQDLVEQRTQDGFRPVDAIIGKDGVAAS